MSRHRRTRDVGELGEVSQRLGGSRGCIEDFRRASDRKSARRRDETAPRRLESGTVRGQCVAEAGKRHGRPTLKCSGSSVTPPANYETIVKHLTGHGYTRRRRPALLAISTRNPRETRVRRHRRRWPIGWTPLPLGFVTGNAGADLRTQLAQILIYNHQWSQYIRPKWGHQRDAGRGHLHELLQRPGYFRR